MGNFVITTDSTADLPASFLDKYEINPVFLYYSFADTIYGGDVQMSNEDFYEKMRQGETATTMAANPEEAIAVFRPYLQKGLDVIHISFTSALSSTYDAVMIASRTLEEEFPDRKIIVIDSLCASLGEGLLVMKAYQLKEQGKTFEEVSEWIEENKLNICHLFTVDDLQYLARGGRISKAKAIIGSLASIKPILHVDNEGKLVPLSSVRGRKKVISTLVEMMDKAITGFENQNDLMAISHGDCLEEAEKLASMIRHKFGECEIVINCISPTIGAHSGPGTLSVFFTGSPR